MRSKLLVLGLGVLTAAALTTADEKPSLAEAPKAVEMGAVAGSVAITKDGSAKANRSGVAVYIENVPGGLPAAKTREMRQKNLTFTPGVMVVVKGTTVEFPNDDKVFHNVFSVSRPARFDLGLYKSGESKAVTFKQAGVVDVYCNIHPQMIGKIKVLDTGYYAVTGADGSFRIKNVPVGTYPLVAWQAYGEEHRGEVKVTANGTATVSISLVEGKTPQTHLRKDGTPYGRYK